MNMANDPNVGMGCSRVGSQPFGTAELHSAPAPLVKESRIAPPTTTEYLAVANDSFATSRSDLDPPYWSPGAAGQTVDLVKEIIIVFAKLGFALEESSKIARDLARVADVQALTKAAEEQRSAASKAFIGGMTAGALGIVSGIGSAVATGIGVRKINSPTAGKQEGALSAGQDQAKNVMKNVLDGPRRYPHPQNGRQAGVSDRQKRSARPCWGARGRPTQNTGSGKAERRRRTRNTSRYWATASP